MAGEEGIEPSRLALETKPITVWTPPWPRWDLHPQVDTSFEDAASANSATGLYEFGSPGEIPTLKIRRSLRPKRSAFSLSPRGHGGHLGIRTPTPQGELALQASAANRIRPDAQNFQMSKSYGRRGGNLTRASREGLLV